MHVTCDRMRLQEALSVLGGTVPTHSPSPISEDVLLEAEGDRLRLRASDGTVFAELVLLEVGEAGTGKAAVPFVRLASLVRELEGEQVSLRREEGEYSLSVEAGEDKFGIVGHNPDEFPEVPAATGVEGVEVEGETLAEGLRYVAFAASKDASRQQLQGVAFIFAGKKLYLVASDGRRLAEYTLSLSKEYPKRIEGIVPPRGVETLIRFLPFLGGEVLLRLDPQSKQLFVEHERGSVLCKLVEGQMPDYLSMVPTEFQTTVEGSARNILQAVRKASVLTTKDQSVVFLDVRGGALQIRVFSHDVGHGVVPVPGVEVRGDEVSLGFTVGFLADGLRILGDEPVRVGLNARGGPSVMHGRRNFRYAFMPVVLRGEAV